MSKWSLPSAACVLVFLFFSTCGVSAGAGSHSLPGPNWDALWASNSSDSNCTSIQCHLPPFGRAPECKFSFGSLVCQNETCCQCETNDDCQNPSLHCHLVHNGTFAMNMCVHKRLFPNFDLEDGLMGGLAFVAVSLASSAGVGGGGVLVPLYMQVSKWPIQQASALSQSTIFGAGITNLFFFGRQNHPMAPWRPLIEYDVCLLFMAPIIAGSIVGVFLNSIFPEWLTAILLVVAVTAMTVRTVKKGVKSLKNEKSGTLKEARKPSESTMLLNPLQRRMSMKIEKKESKKYPWKTITAMCAQICILIVMAILKGGHGSPSVIPGVQCGNVPYYLLFFGPIAILAIFMVITAHHLHKGYKAKEYINYDYPAGDIKWTKRNVCVNPIAGIIAGIMAGLLGLGGGTVIGPLLLEFGMLPLPVAATSAVMVMATAMSTTTQFLVNGTLDLEYAGFLALIGLLSSIFGHLVIGRLLKKYKKTSYITFFLSFILATGVVLIIVQGVEDVIKAGKLSPFSSPC